MEQTVINNEDYKLKVKKTWVKATEQWHIQFVSDNVNEYTFELFLTEDELEHLRRVL
jgi:hypothetical protein